MGQRLLLLTAVMSAAGIAPASAGADARLDKSFGKSGYVTTSAKGSTLVGYGAAVTGNRIVLAGQADKKSGDGQVIVARYRSNGNLDRGFAKRGIFESALPKKDGPFLATAVVPAGSGKLLVAGGYGQGSMLAMRLTNEGRLDKSFGKKGIATAEVGGTAGSIAVEDDGSILLGGSNANSNGRPMVVARMTSAGKLDSTFGNRGIAEALFWDPTLAASAGAAGVAPTADGGVVAFGHLDYIGGDGHGSAGVFQLTSAGQPDAGFGTGGGVEVAFTNPAGGFAQWFPCGFGIDSQDRITITGDGSMGATDGILTTRLTPAGVPDPTFGEAGDGRAFVPGAKSDSDTTCGATVASTGTMTMGVGPSLAQLTPEGAPDTSFGPGGVLGVKKPKGVSINAVAPSGNGRVVVAGSANSDLYVARYRLP